MSEGGPVLGTDIERIETETEDLVNKVYETVEKRKGCFSTLTVEGG